MTIGYLGQERFGIWMTVASIAGMLSFMDFGVGNGLVSQIAKSNTANDEMALRNTITRGLSILLVIGLLVGFVLTFANWIYPISDVLKIESMQAKTDARLLITTFIILFAINIPLNGLFKILLGLQKSWYVHVIKSGGSLFSIALVYGLARNEAAPHYLLFATYGIQVLLPLFVLPFFVRHSLFNFKANENWLDAKSEYLNLVSFGGLFLVLQLGMMVGWGADSLIISVFSGVSAVAQFAIVQKLFQLVSIPVVILNTPLWGAYADAYAQGDTNFIRKTLRASLLGTFLVSSSLSIVVYFGSDLLLHVWIDDQIEVSRDLFLGFAIWKVLQSMGNSFSMALNGMHIVKVQVVSVLLLCAITLPLKLYFTPIYGSSGVIWSTIFAYSTSTVLFYIVIFRRHLINEFSRG